MLSFEWDPDKARKNIENHKVSFDEASTTFKDTKSITIYDPLHSLDEDRFIIIGISCKNRLLITVHTDISNKIRLISSRKAKKDERKHYEENAKRSGIA
jgi:hypothetical protein